MRISAFLLPPALVLTTAALAQTGFSTRTYPAVLPSTSDNTILISADFNGDGRPDLFSYGSRGGASTIPGNVLLNNGSGGFLAPVALSGTGFLGAVAVGDMNGDGYRDIVACTNINVNTQNRQVSIAVYLNSGTGIFKALPAVTAQGQCSALTLGDINHDGRLDVLTVGTLPGQYNPGGQFFPGDRGSIDFFINNGDGHFGEQSSGLSSEFDDKASGSQYTNCTPIGKVG